MTCKASTTLPSQIEQFRVVSFALDLREAIPFRCYLPYHCYSKRIQVDNCGSEPSASMRVLGEGKAIFVARVAESASEHLLSNVFGYCSGGTRHF